jgi:hypothetical protein
MSDRTLTVLGVIVSVLGLAVSVITVFFTDYKIAALISLFVVEAAMACIWFFFARQKNKAVYPYPYDCKLRLVRYVFDTPDKMTFELTEVSRITSPNIPEKLVKLTWSGRGKALLETPLLTQKPLLSFDGNSGEISFTYPTAPDRKFGDTSTIHFKLDLDDTSGSNRPELYTRITFPIQLVVMEVILKYKETSEPALVSSRLMEGQPSPFDSYQKLADLPFDAKSRSYRMIIPTPTLNHVYQIKWER